MSPTKRTMIMALERIEDLPTLPTVVKRVEETLQDKNADAEAIAAIISEDPSLTSKILRVVNSAYYGAKSGSITSVQNAVARLGMVEVSKLCTVLAVIETFRDFGSHLDHHVFWKHSLLTGITTRIIHSSCQTKAAFSADEAYVAGLLHDVGTLIVDQYFPAIFEETRRQSKDKNVPCYEVESTLLAMDHGEIGAYVLYKWKLPQPVVEAVSWHHQLKTCDPVYKNIISAIHLADSICLKLGIGDILEEAPDQYSETALANLSLTEDDLPSIAEKVLEETTRCDSFLAS